MVSADARLDRFLQRMEENKDMLLSNRRRIAEFIESRQAKGNAPNTCIKYLYPLYQMNALGWIAKPFDELTKKDIENIINKSEKKGWSAKTKKNLRISLKVFYKWLEGEEKFAPNEYPARVKFVSTTIPKRERKELTFNDILTREEVTKMAQTANNAMHKALLWVAFESGGRPEEVLNLKKSDVIFDARGTKIFLKGAKSKRPVRLISATEPLRDWMRKHPLAEQKDFDVWVTQFSKKKDNNPYMEGKDGNIIKDKEGKPVPNPSYRQWVKIDNSGANKLLKKLAAKCNINNKKITFYSLRKGRATELASNPKISRSILHAYMGWEEGSTVSKSYVKLNDEQVEDAILASNGIEIENKKIDSYIECQICGAKNSPSALYCERQECGKPLILGDMQSELKGLIKQLRGGRKLIIEQLLNDPNFEKEMLQRLEEKKTEKQMREFIGGTTGY